MILLVEAMPESKRHGKWKNYAVKHKGSRQKNSDILYMYTAICILYCSREVFLTCHTFILCTQWRVLLIKGEIPTIKDSFADFVEIENRII